DSPVIRTAVLIKYQFIFIAIVLVLGTAAYVGYVLYRHAVGQKLRTKFAGANLALWGVVCGALVTGALAVLVIFPHWTNWPGRVVLVPLVLGAWVPLLSYLTSLSYRMCIPVLTSIVVVAVISSWFYDAYRVRVLPGAGGAEVPLTMDGAVALWQKRNNCDGAPSKCPPPIIVAAAGGASRAAFTMASTLGLLMDATCIPAARAPNQPPLPCGGHPTFSDRVFAISAVSGGALGAGMFVAALRVHQEAPNGKAAPCRDASGFWFRQSPTNWRECMQALLSDDFLSPAIIGLAFRDQLPFIKIAMDDRAILLE